MKLSEKFKDFKFWMKEKFVFPVQNWYLNHFNWIHMEGQVFNDGDLIYIVWNGEYNKKTSLIEKLRCPKLFKKLDWVYDGSVIQCYYIWGMDGFLRNIRLIKCVMTVRDIVLCVNGVKNTPSYLRGKPSDYLVQFENFCEARKNIHERRQ